MLRAVRAGALRVADESRGGHLRFRVADVEEWARRNGLVRRHLPAAGAGPLLSSADLALRLRVSTATVVRAVQRGLFTPTATTPGGHYRFSRDYVAVAAEALHSIAAREPIVSGAAAPQLDEQAEPEEEPELRIPDPAASLSEPAPVESRLKASSPARQTRVLFGQPRPTLFVLPSTAPRPPRHEPLVAPVEPEVEPEVAVASQLRPRSS